MAFMSSCMVVPTKLEQMVVDSNLDLLPSHRKPAVADGNLKLNHVKLPHIDRRFAPLPRPLHSTHRFVRLGVQLPPSPY